jgi:hypothetical protein
MMSTKIITIPVLLICLLAATGYDIKDNERLPSGDWTVGFHLYQAAGFDSIPVRVTSVKSERNKGLSGVELRNRSAQPVTAVKIGWYVSTEGGPGTILAKGESPLLSLPSTLNENESLQFSLPAVSLFKILNPVVRGNTLGGDFSVQVAVTEIVYEDGSTWKFSPPGNVARIAMKYAHAAGDCGNSCRWNEGSGSFICVSADSGETCTIYPDSCMVSACPPGGN